MKRSVRQGRDALSGMEQGRDALRQGRDALSDALSAQCAGLDLLGYEQ